VDGAQAFLDFDPAYITIVNSDGSTATTLIAGAELDTIWSNTVDNTHGEINYMASKASPPFPSGSFALASMWVRAESPTLLTSLLFSTTAPRQTDIVFNYHSVLGPVYPGHIIIIPGTATPTATETPTATATVTPTETGTTTPTATGTPSVAAYLPLILRNR